jgi:hypothetical protein
MQLGGRADFCVLLFGVAMQFRDGTDNKTAFILHKSMKKCDGDLGID